MSDFHFHLDYGDPKAIPLLPKQHSNITCPHCRTPDGLASRIHRSWWQKILLKNAKRYICAACEKTFWVSK